MLKSEVVLSSLDVLETKAKSPLNKIRSENNAKSKKKMFLTENIFQMFLKLGENSSNVEI